MSLTDDPFRPRPPDALTRELTRIEAAKATGERSLALRLADRALRTHPAALALIAPVYAGLLIEEGTYLTMALTMLARADRRQPSAPLSATLIETLLKLHQPALARATLDETLKRYVLGATHPLATLARQAAGPDTWPGFIGLGRGARVLGWLGDRSAGVSISIGGTPVAPTRLRWRDNRRGAAFEVALRPDDHGLLAAESQDNTLVGSGLLLPPVLTVESHLEPATTSMDLWVRFPSCPDYHAPLRILDETGASIRPKPRKKLAGSSHFTLVRPRTGLSGARWTMEIRDPFGRWQRLPGSPFLWPEAARAGLPKGRPLKVGSRTRTPPKRVRRRVTDIIIPVYAGLHETIACLDSVLAHLDSSMRVVVVDDATPEPAIASHLDELAARGRIELIRHTQNRGFVASVNAAARLHPEHDLVLLNADTVVPEGWLTRLRAAAYADSTVGTVTPWTNDGTITSYPGGSQPIVTATDASRLDTLARTLHRRVRIPLPVGVGFCLYVRRDCWQATGPLDADVFGRGYGEETDFCMRARALGYTHLLAADVFVLHVGGRSFGHHRQALLARSQRLVNLRHPGYDAWIAKFLARDPLAAARRRLDEARLSDASPPVVLLVTLALEGGVERFVSERVRTLREAGFRALVLHPAGVGNRQQVRLWTDELEVRDLAYRLPSEQRLLLAFLQTLPIDHLEINHFLHLDPRLIEALTRLAPHYDVQLHDYAWLCPQITLINATGRYCGEPALKDCRSCVRTRGSAIGESISVPDLRARSARWLGRARRILAPSHDTLARYQRHFPTLSMTVKGHSTPVPMSPSLPIAAGRVRVVLFGGIGDHKGYRILLDCARDAARRRLDLEFLVIGYTQDDAALMKTGRVFVTGRYQEGEDIELLRREGADVCFMASVWPETWCYTLDTALASGLPVVAFDLGAIAERLRDTDRGSLFALGTASHRLNREFLRLGALRRSNAPIF
jgi:GT2 family glycosyltransferase/glycosyltransferase involved in cell wall biosynthesis